MKLRATLILLAALHGAWPAVCRSEWQHYGPPDGLAGRQVISSLEARNGDLWFGTWDGLSRYDGVTWNTFTRANGLPNDHVLALAEDRDGNIWAGGYGLSRYDGKDWRILGPADGWPNLYAVRSMQLDHLGRLWIGTDGGGVTCYDGTTWKTFTTADGLSSDIVYDIEEDRTGKIWLAGGNSLSRYDGSTWDVFPTSGYIPASQVLEDSHGNIWAAGYGGVSRYDGTEWKTDTLTDQVLQSLAKDRFGNVWVGGFLGLHRFDGAHWQDFTTADGLADDNVTTILFDRAGNLWAGTYFQGLSRFDGVVWKTFGEADGVPNEYIYATARDSAGYVWFGTSNDGVRVYDGLYWQHLFPADSIPSYSGTAVFIDHQGTDWVGTMGGVSRYDGSGWRTYHLTLDSPIRGIVEDDSGGIWCASYGSGIFYIGKGNPNVPYSPSQYLQSAMRDRHGNLWFGGGGAYRFDGSSLTRISRQDGLIDDDVSALLEDHEGNIWFGTAGGVSRFDGATWKSFTASNGLADNKVNAIFEDRYGALWFCTSSGISRYRDGVWGSYSRVEGDPLASDQVTSMTEDRNGGLWFGTSNGITRLQPDLIPPSTRTQAAPPGLLAARTVSGSVVAAFGETKGVRYSFRFDGGPWSQWSTSGSWLEAGVADGTHIVEARSRDRIGNIDPHPDSVTFEIDATPPSPIISAPPSNAILRGAIEVRGRTADLRFKSSRCSVTRAGVDAWTILSESSLPVVDGPIATWNVDSLLDGVYQLRLEVTDTLGLTGTAFASVFIQRNPTDTIPAATGGEFYAADHHLRLYFPPHAFTRDARVTITPLPQSPGSETLPDGATLISSGDSVEWGGASLEKPGLLEFRYRDALGDSASSLALYHGRGGTWERLGGTVDSGTRRISSQIRESGPYAVFAGGAAVRGGEEPLGSLSSIPRVLTTRALSGVQDLTVGFSLGRPAAVTAKVFNRAGRMVRVLAADQPMGAGANLVRWNGRDIAGDRVSDGLYFVTVEALGRRRTLSVSVTQ